MPNLYFCFNFRNIHVAFNNFRRSQAAQVLVLVTDGEANDREDAIEQANMAKRDGVHIVTIGKFVHLKYRTVFAVFNLFAAKYS